MADVRFITEFHNLSGISLAQKKKSLFHLFHTSHLNTNPALLDSVTAKLQPLTHLERLFFIEFLIYHQRHDELTHEIFVKENEFVLKKVKNQRWFFEKCLSGNACEFLKKVVPTISYNLTLKVLKIILPLLQEEAADEIFNFLNENYGISVAIHLISSCSTNKIKQILSYNCVHLKLKHLEKLFDKNFELVYIYLQEREKYEGNRNFMDSNPIFRYIARKNIEIYLDLCQKYDFKLKLGKRVTRKIVRNKRGEILTHPKLHVKNLHARSLIKLLGPDFPGIFLELFPKKAEDGPRAEASRLLQHCPKSQKYDLLVSTYNQIFAKKLEDSPGLIDEYILKMIPDSTERERMARMKCKDGSELLLNFCRPDTCLQVIKEKINFAREPFARGLLMITLVECCVINNDYEALLRVAKYVNERFKNDNIQVLDRFLQTLSQADFSKFTEEHWKEIEKIIARVETWPPNCYANIVLVFYKRLEYLLDHKKNVKDAMLRFFRKHSFEPHHMSFLHKKYMESFFSEFVKLIPEIATSSNSIEVLDCKLLAACPKQSDVVKFPRLAQSLRRVLEQKMKIENVTVSSALQVVLSQNTEDVEKLREDFWNWPQFATPFIVRWFVKYRPDLIELNLTKFLKYSIFELAKDKKFWQSLKYYTDAKLVQFFSSSLTPAKYRVLSYFLSKEDFFRLLESHKTAQLDLQISLLKGLKNVDEQGSSLPLILQFCSNEYAPFCREPLFEALLKTPKTHLGRSFVEMKKLDIPWLTKFAYSSMSVLGTVPEVLQILEECPLDECIEITFKYFLRNPSESTWQLFTSKFQAATEINKSTSRLLATRRVPTKYRARHFETIWTGFQRTQNKYVIVLLKNVLKGTILELKPEFLDVVIAKELFQRVGANMVASIYFIGSSDNGKILFDALQRYKASPEFSMKRINKFVMTLFTTYMQSERSNENLIQTLLTEFQRVFTTAEIFEEFIIINFMAFKGKSVHDFTLAVVAFYNNILTRFGETIVEIFAEVLKKLLPFFCRTNELLYEFFFLLLSNEKSVAGAVLVIHLLPSEGDPEDAVSFRYYQRVLEDLQSLDFLTTQLYFNLYFQNRNIVKEVIYYDRVGKFCVSLSSWLRPGKGRDVDIKRVFY